VHSKRGGRRFLVVLLLFGVLAGAWIAVLHLVRSQGVILIGDEPHYLVEAVSLFRFHTLDMNPGYAYAVSHHIIYPWSAHPGPHLAAQIGQAIFRHGVYLPFHAIGLSVLLGVPMLAGTSTASVTLILVLAALTVGLAHLTCEVSGTRSPWGLAIGGLFLAPAVCLAATQVFPDLITGLVMAVVVMSIAVVERRGRCNWSEIGVVAALLVVLPWLDQKNIFYPIPLMIAFLVSCGRAKLPAKALRFVVGPTLVSLAGLLALNFYEFGDLLGGPQRLELISSNTWVRALSLLIDHRHGLFVQAPVALIGIAGLWTARKRLPVAVIAGAFVVVTTIYGNATQPDSFGGYSFVGRFQWPTLPILLSFAGLWLLETWKIRKALVAVLVGVIVLSYVLQLVPILRGEHVYYNGSGWDPQTYVGWWGGLDPSPILGYIGRNVFSNARVDLGAVTAVLVCALVVYLLVKASQRPVRWHPWAIGGALVAILAVFPATLSSATLLPTFAEPGLVHALSPTRICDSRADNPSDLGGQALQCSDGSRGSRLVANRILTIAVTDAFDVPAAGVTAVMLNVTTTDAAAGGSLTVFPGDQSPPSSPSLFFLPGRDSSTFVQVSTGSTGTVSLVASATTDVVVDLEGYVSSTQGDGGGRYRPVGARGSGARVCATVPPVGASSPPSPCGSDGGPGNVLAPGSPVTMVLAGQDGVPASGASAALLSVAVRDPAGPGHLSAYPADRPAGVAAVLNFTTGTPSVNQVVVPLSSTGSVTFSSSAPTDLAVRLLGYFAAGAAASGGEYTPEITPVRICDTRGGNPSGLEPPATQCNPAVSAGRDLPLRAGGSRSVRVVGLGYVPTEARAVVLVVTALPGSAPGYLSVDPDGPGALPADLTYLGGVAQTGTVTATLSSAGSVRVANVGPQSANVVVDLVGWYG
jgi:hypothetical protein